MRRKSRYYHLLQKRSDSFIFGLLQKIYFACWATKNRTNKQETDVPFARSPSDCIWARVEILYGCLLLLFFITVCAVHFFFSFFFFLASPFSPLAKIQNLSHTQHIFHAHTAEIVVGMCNKKGWRPMKPLTSRSVALLSLLDAAAVAVATGSATLIGVIYFLLDATLFPLLASFTTLTLHQYLMLSKK